MWLKSTMRRCIRHNHSFVRAVRRSLHLRAAAAWIAAASSALWVVEAGQAKSIGPLDNRRSTPHVDGRFSASTHHSLGRARRSSGDQHWQISSEMSASVHCTSTRNGRCVLLKTSPVLGHLERTAIRLTSGSQNPADVAQPRQSRGQ
jgi:hypothetical protein